MVNDSKELLSCYQPVYEAITKHLSMSREINWYNEQENKWEKNNTHKLNELEYL